MADDSSCVAGPSRTKNKISDRSSKKKHVRPRPTPDEIFDLLADGNISDLELSDEEEFGCVDESAVHQHVLPIIPGGVIDHTQDVEYDPNEGDNDSEYHPSDDDAADDPGIDDVADMGLQTPDELADFILTEKREIKWRRRNVLQPPDCAWDPPSNIGITEPLAPVDYFERYIPMSLYETMAEMTNIYALTNNVRSFPPTCAEELRVFVGLHMIMGSLGFPRISLYWDSALHINIFVDSMTRNRFYKLRNNVHLVNINIDHGKNDRVYKIRPIFDSVRKRCMELDVEQQVAVDEQMVPFKGQLNIKQYMKGKPNPWGVKLFLICGTSGLAYDFLIYQGKTTELRPDVVARTGQGASVVLHLANRLSKPGHQLFCDNYFTSYHLLQILKQKGIMAVGTVRVNRFANPSLINDKDLKKKERGFSDEVFSTDTDVVMVKWLDNKPVTLASNFIGIGEQDVAKRWDKKKSEYVHIQRPEIIKQYNHAMGGVDLLDMLIGLYRIHIRSKKWTLRLIFHAVDLAVTNSWIEYKRDCELSKVPAKSIMDLLQFRMRTAEALILAGNANGSNKITSAKKRGRPSSVVSPDPPTTPKVPKKNHCEQRPIAEVRYDLVDHMPIHTGSTEAGRCKSELCKKKTNIRCEKCSVYLCLTKDRNCFRSFHKK